MSTDGTFGDAGRSPDRDATDVDASGLLLDRDSDVQPTLSVIMPTLNEEEGVSACIDRIKAALADLRVPTEIIVSDSSDDRTPEIAREKGAIVVEPDEAGYGNAYKYAFEHVRGEWVAIGDADTTYDFGELPKLLERARETDADMVLGSRLDGEIKEGAMPPLHQYVGNPLLTRFLNTFYDAGVSDAHSGMRVLRAEALAELDLQSGGMEFASEMIMVAAEEDLTIAEVPITYHPRVGDATLDSFRDGWRHVKFMLTNAPGYLFSVPALTFGLASVAILLASLRGGTLGGVTFGPQTAIGGFLLGLVGYQVGSLGLFSSVAAEPIKEPDDPLTNWVRARFRLEHGATIGVALSVLGVGYFAYTLAGWTVGGSAALPDPTATLAAAGVVVIGVQTVFNSFFLSMLSERTT